MSRKHKRLLPAAALALLILILLSCRHPTVQTAEERIVIATWNLRGYPESREAERSWFSHELVKIDPDVLCVQEIANQNRVDTFLADERHFTSVAFHDSPDGQDNAIFATSRITLADINDPVGFQHPPQAVFVAYRGFDAVLVTVHLSWTDTDMRNHEKTLLKNAVIEMLHKDPDVIVAGDFNTNERDIQELAQALGMKVMIPSGQEGVGTTHAGNRYDYFLISPDLADEEAITCHIETFTGDDLETAKKVSDHLPVLAAFRTDERFRDRK